MTVSEAATLLKRLKPPFLDGMDPAEISTVLAAGTHRRYLANSVVTNQGHPASSTYLVLTGGARSFYLTQAGQKLHIHWYPPGEVFGGMALVSKPSPYLLSTECTKSSQVLVWQRQRIRALTERYPRLLDNALSIASNYLDLAIATQVSLSFHSARQRLAFTLMNLASGIGHRVPGGVELHVRNEELAASSNITPFTASRVIGEWEKIGLVKKSRGKVLIPHPERLVLQEL